MEDKILLQLIDKFSSSQVAELELDDGSIRLILRKECAVLSRGPAAPGGTAASVSAENSAADTAGDSPVRLGLPVNTVPGASVPSGETITSPIVATFYSSPSPEDAPFVKPGSRVKAGDTLCILEAMKMMNRLEAEFDCEVISVKAENGALVEYGEALFEVKRL